MSVSTEPNANAPTMESILETELPEDLYSWAQVPMSIVELDNEPDGQTYRATWPSLELARSMRSELDSLTLFLNLASPNFADEGAIRGDLDLQIGALDRFPAELRAKHAASFPKLWGKHEAYARRAYDALDYKPTVGSHSVEVEGVEYTVCEAAFCGFEEEVEALKSHIAFFPEERLRAIFTQYDVPFPTKLVKNPLSALDEPESYANSTFDNSKSVVTPHGVKKLLERHPEAANSLLECIGAVIFDGSKLYGGKLVAYGTDKTKEELEAIFISGDGIQQLRSQHIDFDYVVIDQHEEIAPIMPSVSIRDPRPHLQPTLVWKRDEDGRREVIYDAEIVERGGQDGNTKYQIVEDPMLGVLIPFIFSPSFRADEALWPKRDSLPTDKIAKRRGEIDDLRTNNISPATVVLQAIRKRHDVVNYFPFERLEEAASR